jgi:hypothetical protein
VDWQGYYGGDEFVMKAAGHELKVSGFGFFFLIFQGLMAIYQCQLRMLHVPLSKFHPLIYL